MIGRFWLGVLLALAGFWLGVVRAVGGFGNPLVVDGATLLVLLLIGAGLCLVAQAVDAAKREFREQDEEREREQ